MRASTQLVCPLTGRLFEDAVITTCCGTSYSKPAILSRLETQGACPSCGTAAAKVKTLPNSALREGRTAGCIR